MPDDSHDALMQELLQMFAVEAEEHLRTLNSSLLKLEKQPPAAEKEALIKAVFRAAHSLKGSARAVGLMDIEALAHEAENILNAARNQKLEFSAEVVDALLEAADSIEQLVAGKALPEGRQEAVKKRLQAVMNPPPPAAEPSPAPGQSPLPAPPQPLQSLSVEPSAAASGLELLMQELLQMFAIEAAEHLQTLSSTLLKLENQPPDAEKAQLVNSAFRAAHSLKGSARAVELLDIEGVAHDAESVLNAARNQKLDFSGEVVDALLSATDTMQALTEGKAVEAAQLQALRQKLQAIAERAKGASPALKSASKTLEAPNREATSPPETPPPATAPPTAPAAATPASPAASSPTAAPPPSRSNIAAPEETIRVSVEKLDDLMAQAGELIVSKISADERLRELRDLRSLLSRWEKVWTQTTDLQRRIDHIAREGEGQPEWREVLDFLSLNHSYFTESIEKLRSLDKSMTNDNMRMSLVTEALQDEIRRVRMLPVDTLVPTMERVVRDVARQTGKRAQLTVRGADVELDKKVLEALKDPLVHLLRNSVDHGIELPEQRQESGKPELGTVSVTVTQRGGNVHMIIADDGKGIDASAVKRSSIAQGLLNELEAENMPDEEAYLLIFQAGLSTKEEVTAVSGRGVGMDVVKAQLEALQGRISVRSVPGAGSEFHLILPISLATIRGLIVRIGLDRYALPHHAVEKIVTINAQEVYTVEGNRMFDLNSEPMPIIFLADLLERPRDPPHDDRLLAIIVAGAERRMAFVVDEFVSEQEMVVKPLGKQLRRVRNVAGATLLGTGVPIVILNVADLLRSALGGRVIHKPMILERRPEDSVEKAPARILVVDDSITTRTLERNILTGAGYQVRTATDGVEALALLETESFDLVVSDIEMPRIDGFELVEWIRQSPSYGKIPVILVTSLESQEHRERGLRVGADAYIVKSGFEQAHLLETIQQFVD